MDNDTGQMIEPDTFRAGDVQHVFLMDVHLSLDESHPYQHSDNP